MKIVNVSVATALSLTVTLALPLTLAALAQGGGRDVAKEEPEPVRKHPVALPPTAADIKRGKALYKQYDCAACHRIGKTGCAEGVPLDGTGRKRSAKFIADQLRDPEEHVSRNPKAFGADPINLMPPSNLDEREITFIVRYLQSLR